MRRLLRISALLISILIPCICYGGQSKIQEAGLVFDLPQGWSDKPENATIPTGQLMQTWKRDSMDIQNGAATARAGMIALVTPVNSEANLVMITQARLNGNPFFTKIPDAQCVKCVRYKAKTPEATIGAISYEPPPDCQEKPLDTNEDFPCKYERIDKIKLNLEPSWAFIIDKKVNFGILRIMLIHALLDSKLLEITFSYPAELAEPLEQEIAGIVSSIKRP